MTLDERIKEGDAAATAHLFAFACRMRNNIL